MSQATERLVKAHEVLNAALAEIRDASLAITDEDYTLKLPSVLVCNYDPVADRGSFTLLGTVHHLAQGMERALADPGNEPFRQALARAIDKRLKAFGE